jgi:hypothetical protein
VNKLSEPEQLVGFSRLCKDPALTAPVYGNAKSCKPPTAWQLPIEPNRVETVEAQTSEDAEIISRGSLVGPVQPARTYASRMHPQKLAKNKLGIFNLHIPLSRTRDGVA